MIGPGFVQTLCYRCYSPPQHQSMDIPRTGIPLEINYYKQGWSPYKMRGYDPTGVMGRGIYKHYIYIYVYMFLLYSLPETNTYEPENGWLEDSFPFKMPFCKGAKC